MIKVLKFAKSKWYIILLILSLLMVQVYCELILPNYTSDIVDVGIQSKGIEYPIPNVMSSATYSALISGAKNDSDKDLIELAYQEGSEKDTEKYNTPVYKINEKNLNKGQREKLISILLPIEIRIIANYMPTKNSDVDLEKLESYPEYILSSIGVKFVEYEYTNLGIDISKYQMDYLKMMGVKMLIYALIILLISAIVGLLSSRLAAFVGKDLRSKIFSKIMSFGSAEFNNFGSASLITRCTNDISQVQTVLTLIFRIVIFAPLMGFGAVFRVLNTTTSMTWVIFLAVISVLMIVAILILIAMPKFKIMQKLIDNLNLVSRELLTGLPVIRAFGRERYEEQRFDAANEELMKTQLFTAKTMALMMPTMMFSMNGVSALIIWVGAHKIDQGIIQVGDMMAFLTYAMHIVISFLLISAIAIFLPRAAVAADRIDEILNAETLINDCENPKTIEKNVPLNITFENVSFRYPGAEEDALKNISFTAPSGKTTAIIGSTGCGKSTLVHMIPRLFDVSDGRITINGTDIREISMKNLRENIGFVPQKGTLFSGTIRSNIKFGANDATDEDVINAATISQATEFIDEKPKKYDESVSQGGSNVSGGQKQRLSIARAIAKNPGIFIFDDSFSALDFKTDAALRKSLKEKTKDATIIIVAQRISTILNADNILVLDDGEIVGHGTHSELIRDNEVYKQIAASQLSEKDIENTLNKGNARKEVLS